MTMLALAILAAALQSGPPAPVTILRGSMSRVDEARQVAARTDAEWRALWRLHAGDEPAPAVDLRATSVVAVFLGTRMTGGFAVEVTGTRREGDVLVVEWREERPPRDAITAQVITSPFHLAAIPRFEGEIRFEKAGK